MNNKTQLDFHPDAETLSAFAERVLANQEHEEISAHLAICEMCRQVVFLAQEAATQEELAALSVGKAGTTRKSWFWNWRFLWAPAAAMAMALMLALYVHLNRTTKEMEMAKATQQASPLAMTGNGADASHPTEVPPAAGVPMRKPGVASNRPPGMPMTQFHSAVSGEKGTAVAGGTEKMAAPGSIGATPPKPGSVDEFKPQPVESAGASEPLRADVMTQAQASETEAERSREERQGQSVDAKGKDTSPAFAPASPPAVGFAAGIKATRAVALNAPKVSALPTGMPATSTVKGTRATVALDETGNMFVSTDNGSHWESVARQWSGRAVTVRTQTKTPEIYELVNDHGQRWVSPDGLVWTAE